MTIPSPPTSSPLPSDDALDEALRQLERLDDAENERRRAADKKLGNLQGTLSFVVTLTAGSFGLSLFRSAPADFDVWIFLMYVALGAALAFLVWAAEQIRKANDPQPYQYALASGITRVLQTMGDKRSLVEQAIKDLNSIIDYNMTATDRRLTLYRAAIVSIGRSIYCLVAIPALFFLSLLWGHCHR